MSETETSGSVMDERPFCARCKDDFEVAREPAAWRMGYLRRMAKAPARIRRQFPRNELTEKGNYLCGNCYFDLTDGEA